MRGLPVCQENISLRSFYWQLAFEQGADQDSLARDVLFCPINPTDARYRQLYFR